MISLALVDIVSYIYLLSAVTDIIDKLRCACLSYNTLPSVDDDGDNAIIKLSHIKEMIV